MTWLADSLSAVDQAGGRSVADEVWDEVYDKV